ncbi:MAG TPA: NBR1-Ig-like domain-containing protein, partial [Anaerolineales bacterium]|nr:NBR1-Ig-like domain-containing protein [Anaerolineales bacterium]
LAIVRDVNYPSGTTVKAGDVITKTWKVQNTGSCDWNYNYALVIVSDENFRSTWSKIGKVISPGNWSEISVILEVPNHDGTFTGSWRLADAGGNAFGATLSVSIVVVE